MHRWIQLTALIVFVTLTLAADSPPPGDGSTHNMLSAAEKNAGWTLLFDGKSTQGWRGLGVDGFPDKRWNIKDNCLHSVGGKGGNIDLITVDTYENFELSWEWTMPKEDDNSGIKYRIQETRGKSSAYGPEYQMMTDADKIDKHTSGALYDVLPPKPGKHVKPPGEFNSSRIVQKGDHVEHWLNGVKVCEFDFKSDEVKKAVAASKFKKNDDWGKKPRGYIALTDHTDEAYFRNVKVRELPAK